MRASYRFAWAAAVGLAGLLTFLAWYAVDPRSPESPVAAPNAGIEVEKMDEPVGRPDPEKVAAMLDKVEAAETQKLGAAEAHRRRLQREQILEQRLRRDGP